MFEKHRNPDGTYSGTAALSEATGLSQAEITWAFQRMKDLLREGKTVLQVKDQVREEAKDKPWEKPNV